MTAGRTNDYMDEQHATARRAHMTREDRRAARARRHAAREDRQKQRAIDRLKCGGVEPPPVQLPENTDPLRTYDRQGRSYDNHPYRDLWKNSAGFLVCGGPSLKTYNLERLRERGIVSLAINNAAAFAPVKAMVFSDPAEKFHAGVFLDPAIIKFVPAPKLKNRVRAKLPNGTFQWTSYFVRDCPAVVGIERDCEYDPENFLKREAATWGNNAQAVQKNGKPKILFTFFLGLRLAHYLGIRQLFLLGVDFYMDPSGNNNYAWNDPRGARVVGGNNAHYRRAIEMCAELKPIFDAAGFHVYNCNPNSALRAFPYVPYEQAIEHARGPVPREPLDCEGYYGKDGGAPGDDSREQDD